MAMLRAVRLRNKNAPQVKPDQRLPGRRRATVIWHRLLRSFLYIVSFIFLLLVVIGSVHNQPVLRNTYFLKIDLANIVPLSVPNAQLINSIAQTIGLHDFYQVGLWGFCEGYQVPGVTDCSHPQAFYAFDPIKIILSELEAGATIALPAGISRPLHIAKVASHWMYGLYMASTILSFVMIFLAPWAVSSRPPQTISGDLHTNASHPVHRRRTFLLLRALPFTILTFFAALLPIAASIIATVMFSIFVDVFASAQPTLNIRSWLGAQMLAFMWLACGFALLAFVVQSASCFAACCGGRKARRQLKMATSQNPDSQEKRSSMNGLFAAAPDASPSASERDGLAKPASAL